VSRREPGFINQSATQHLSVPDLSVPDVTTVASGPGNDSWAPAEAVLGTIPLGGRVCDIAVSPDGEYVYVAQSDSVSVIGRGHHVVARIPFTGHPHHIGINAAGTRLFVTSYGGSVSVINTDNYAVHTIAGGWNSDLAVSPDGGYLYAAHNEGAGGGRDSFISVIDTKGTPVTAVRVANDVTDLAVSHDGARIYAVSSAPGFYYQYPAGRLSIIDTTCYAVTDTIAVGACPGSITVGSDDARLFITHPDTHSVSAVDLMTNNVTAIALEDAPQDVTITPDCTHAYVTNRHSVTVIDTGTYDATEIATGQLPRGLAISPDGKLAYITNLGDHTVSVVDTITNSDTATVIMNGYPEAIAMSPSGERLYVGDYWSGTLTVISIPSVQDQHTRALLSA
jgi:YVTN family beta-propeller protein